MLDNGTQFDSGPFKQFRDNLGIKLCFTIIRHPRSNGAVEWANSNILSSLNRRLVVLARGLWIKELPKVLWSLHTTITQATGFTPFRLLYGDKAMTPTKIKGCSLRVQLPQTTGERDLSLDLTEVT